MDGLGDAAIGPAPGAKVREALGALGWAASPPPVRGAQREQWESLDALVTLADELVLAGAESLADVVESMRLRAETGHSPAASGVTLASLHAAKGLEWEAVFLVGLADGLVPISLATGPGDVAEERRLLYVGVTRAKRHLQLSYAKARITGGNAARRHSRFLDGLWPTSERVAKRARGLDVPELADLTPAGRALFDRLVDWRRELAEGRGSPAFTVLTDLTLRALADRRPKNTKQLAGIPGIGPVKSDTYGPAILAIIAEQQTNP
jgi:DNA helicase-2/ATP-dependent DNA helicase PcrA